MVYLKFIRALFVNDLKNIAKTVSLIAIVLLVSYFQLPSYDDPNLIVFHWLGGNVENSVIYVGLIKISFVLIVLIHAGKSMEIFHSNFIYSVTSRTGSMVKVTASFMVYLMLVTVFFGASFHIIYGFVFGVYGIQDGRVIALYNTYVISDIMSLVAMMLLLVVLELRFKIKNQLMIVLSPYMLNFILPISNVIAPTTSKFGNLINQPQNRTVLYISMLVSMMIMFVTFLINFKKEGEF